MLDALVESGEVALIVPRAIAEPERERHEATARAAGTANQAGSGRALDRLCIHRQQSKHTLIPLFAIAGLSDVSQRAKAGATVLTWPLAQCRVDAGCVERRQ